MAQATGTLWIIFGSTFAGPVAARNAIEAGTWLSPPASGPKGS